MIEREPTDKTNESQPPAPGPHAPEHSVRASDGEGSESYCYDCRRWMFLDRRNREIDVFGRLVVPD